MEIEVGIALQGFGEFSQGTEVGGFEDLGDAAIEALHHAIGLRSFGGVVA